ncbi:MAG: outer membrane beta-barrel protein [Bacteroidetes bacterium]|nr:outer membrane beta-barrel protein [Bacteroidota bacterium]
MRSSFFTAFFISLSICSVAQNRITGKISDTSQTALPFITVALLNASDSSIYRGTNTNDKGIYEFENIKAGNYFIEVRAVGYKNGFNSLVSIDSLSQIEIPEIILNTEGVLLNEVSVSVQKKTFEFKGGNITVNVDGSPMAVGNSAYDILSRLPGVTVSNDDISINGSGSAKIVIDGKMQQIPQAQVIVMLKALPGSMIEKMEVLKIPPVKYDAAGGGIIHIYTKKAKITGFSGNVFGGLSQGFYMRYNSGFSLNYKGKKVSLFSGLNANDSPSNYSSIYESNVKNDTVLTRLYQDNKNKTVAKSGSAFLGADWYINEKNVLGFKADRYFGNRFVNRHGLFTMQNSDMGYDLLPYFSDNTVNWSSYNVNVNYEHQFDTLGTKLKIISDYNNADNDNRGENNNRFLFFNETQAQPSLIYNSKNLNGVYVWANQLDFEKKFSKTCEFEAGAKYSYQNLFSNYDLQQQNQNTLIYETDTAFSNQFVYNEQIQAAYANLKKEDKKFTYNFGLRAENTLIKSHSITRGINYDRNYFSLFPLLSADYTHNGNHSYSASFNRRLDRPQYYLFNPYRQFYSNILLSGQGNPNLKPTYSNQLSLTHNYKGKIINALYYTVLQNFQLQYSTLNEQTKALIWQQGNLKYGNFFDWNLSVNLEPKKWWIFSASSNVYLIHYQGMLNDKNYNVSAFSCSMWAYNQFKLGKTLSLTVDGWASSPFLWGIFLTKARGMLNIGFKKTFFKNTLEASISAQDVLNTFNLHNVVKYQNQDYYTLDRYDTRRINFGLTYNFGKIKVQQRKSAGNTEEKKRMER